LTVLLVAALFTLGAGLRGAAQSSGTKPDPKHESPFACDRMALTAAERHRHFEELGPALRALHKDRAFRELKNGYEFEFPADHASFAQVTEWVDGERACCPFFDITLRVEREHGKLWLSLTGREGTKEFIRSDFGKWFN